MINVVIIEDELASKDLLEIMLRDYSPDIQVLGHANNVATAIQLIQTAKPELIFLDIELPDGTGFDVLQAFSAPDFSVIFITGYNDRALEAIRHAAVDYLLKPVNLDALESAISRVKHQLENAHWKHKYEKIKKEKISGTEKFVMITHNAVKIRIKFSDILFIESHRIYSQCHLLNGKKYLLSNPLSYYQSEVLDDSFFRTHKSFIINMRFVKQIERGRAGFVHLEGEHKIPVAARRKPSFLKVLAERPLNIGEHGGKDS